MSETDNMTDDEWLNYYIGVESKTKTCPECGSETWENSAGDEWCGRCSWANSQKMINLTKWLEANHLAKEK